MNILNPGQRVLVSKPSEDDGLGWHPNMNRVLGVVATIVSLSDETVGGCKWYRLVEGGEFVYADKWLTPLRNRSIKIKFKLNKSK